MYYPIKSPMLLVLHRRRSHVVGYGARHVLGMSESFLRWNVNSQSVFSVRKSSAFDDCEFTCTVCRETDSRSCALNNTVQRKTLQRCLTIDDMQERAVEKVDLTAYMKGDRDLDCRQILLANDHGKSFALLL